MRSLRRIMLAALTAALVAIGLPSTGWAAEPSPNNPQLVSTSTVPMTVVGYDEAVARANGYTIRFTADGTPYSVKSTTRLGGAGGVTTQNLVTGNCGSSYVWLYDIGDKKYQVSTGFGVTVSAVQYNWYANVIGPNYNYTHTWGGGLWFSNTWSGTAVGLVNIGGTYTVKATGHAVLSNGLICNSLGPIANESIY